MVVLDIEPGETQDTTDPRVQLTLPGGVYRVILVVEDQAGNRSEPVELQVTVEGAIPA